MKDQYKTSAELNDNIEFVHQCEGTSDDLPPFIDEQPKEPSIKIATDLTSRIAEITRRFPGCAVQTIPLTPNDQTDMVAWADLVISNYELTTTYLHTALVMGKEVMTLDELYMGEDQL